MSKTSLWVRDEANIKRSLYLQNIEKQKQDKIRWAKEQEEDCVFIDNDYISPANEERQLGKVMLTVDFENKLKKLVPTIHFEFNRFNPSMKAYYVRRGGNLVYLGAYHAGYMPEHSIVKRKMEMVWDYKATEKPLNRKDLPKSEWVPGKGIVWDETVTRPGWKKIYKPAGELKRGWRTVLIKLVLEGLLTPHQVEKNFGEPSSSFGKRAWAYHSGKRSDKDFVIPF